MARVALDHKVPQIGMPVGSKAEVEALDIPTRNIATCSRRVEKENFGCPEYQNCDREYRGTRPRNEVQRMVTADGNVRVTVNPCFVCVRKEREADAKGMLVEIIAGEGEEFTYRGSVRVDDSCPDCAKGECKRPHMYRDADDLTMVCPPFKPAAEHRELQRFARLREARLGSSKNKKASLRRQLLGPDEPAEIKVKASGARA